MSDQIGDNAGGAAVGTVLAPRRDEVQRLKDIIGWSWQGLGDQLGWTPAQMHAFKSCKRAMEDHDFVWLHLLAQFHTDNPRPEAPLRAAVAVPARETTMQQVPPAATPANIARALLAETIAKAYRDAADNVDLTPDGLQGARWACGDMAERLGVRDLVVAILKRPEAEPAEVAQPEPRAAPWDDAQPSVGIVPAGGLLGGGAIGGQNRQPF